MDYLCRIRGHLSLRNSTQLELVTERIRLGLLKQGGGPVQCDFVHDNEDGMAW